ncbi:MAG: ribonuclease HII [Alloprevotella sp.]|nr:ribonuclease HII [Alloprevotella sp.]
MLLSRYNTDVACEAGCDEAGRGCLAGSVYAAAVVLPPDYTHPLLNDSKHLSDARRRALRTDIERDALAWAIGTATAAEIDEINILRASILAMHRALDGLSLRPDFIIVDGNRFTPYGQTPHATVVKGDARYLSIAAASILAKTYRDDEMHRLAALYPGYGWERNAGYPTAAHREAIARLGVTPYHRRTFKLVKEG